MSYFTQFLVVSAIASMVGALKCYQTDIQTGKNELIDDEEFVYCVSFPSVSSNHKNRLGYQISTSGLKGGEVDADFDSIFEQSVPAYSVLGLCLYEKYDWPKLWKTSINSSRKTRKAEYQFRCLCNTDVCNAALNFSTLSTSEQ